jgi:HEAT repeat protein
MSALSQPLSQVRAQAALALGKIQARQALPILFSLVGDNHFDVKWQTLEALRLLNDPRAVYGAMMALEDDNPQVRLKALHLIKLLDPSAILSDLVPYLTDSDPDVRWEIASMLLDSTETIAQGVVTATREQPSERRHWVVKRLALQGPSALPDLFDAITDPERGIREQAAITVINLIRTDPTQNIMPELVNLLQNEDQHIRDLGLKILNSTESDSKPSLLANWNRPSDAVKAYVLEALRDTKTETVPALIAALERYKKPTDIWYILDLLSKLADARIAPLLLTYLQESNPTLRWAAARALKNIVAVDAEPALVAALEDPDPRVQTAAQEALIAIREEQRKRDFWTKSE